MRTNPYPPTLAEYRSFAAGYDGKKFENGYISYAWNEGVSARKRDTALPLNPYREDTLYHKSWNAGFEGKPPSVDYAMHSWQLGANARSPAPMPVKLGMLNDPDTTGQMLRCAADAYDVQMAEIKSLRAKADGILSAVNEATQLKKQLVEANDARHEMAHQIEELRKKLHAANSDANEILVEWRQALMLHNVGMNASREDLFKVTLRIATKLDVITEAIEGVAK